jgi:hypothetical protein
MARNRAVRSALEQASDREPDGAAREALAAWRARCR